jgi:hypothetical protein
MFPQALLAEGEDGSVRSALISDGAELLPLAGISRRLTVVCNEHGEYLTYDSDEHGFHNPPDTWNHASVDVVLLGDSFTQGWCVPSGREFASIIRGRYPRTINLGIEGDGPLTMLAAMKEYSPLLKPTITLWCFFEGNDLADLRLEMDSPLLRRYLTDGFTQRLAVRQSEIDRQLTTYMDTFMDRDTPQPRLREVVEVVDNPDDAWSRLVRVMKLSALRARLGIVGNRDRLPPTPEAIAQRARSMADLFESFRQTLLEARRFTEQSGGQLYFVYLPSRDTYSPDGPGPNPDRTRVLEIAREVGLPIIDVHPAFADHGDALALFPYRYGPHYNEQGHKLVAETILAGLPR